MIDIFASYFRKSRRFGYLSSGPMARGVARRGSHTCFASFFGRCSFLLVISLVIFGRRHWIFSDSSYFGVLNLKIKPVARHFDVIMGSEGLFHGVLRRK